jgi:hypothetical protein
METTFNLRLRTTKELLGLDRQLSILLDQCPDRSLKVARELLALRRAIRSELERRHGAAATR